MKKWSMSTLKFGILVFATLLAVALFGSLKSLSAAPPTVKVGYPSLSGSQMRLWVIPEAKLDQRHGVNVQPIFLRGGAVVAQTIVAGDVDMTNSGGAVVNAMLSGADLVYVASGVSTYAFSVYVRPEIKDISGLRGKALGVLTRGAGTEQAAIALLRLHGMRAGQDVKLLYLGTMQAILAALERGIVPAGLVSSPTTLLARRLGYKELVNMGSLKLPFLQASLVTRRSLMRQNPDLVKAFLKAYVAALKTIEEEPEVAKRALARFLAISDTEIIQEVYQAYKPLYSKVPYITEDVIRSVLSVLDHPRAAKADPKDFFDNSFVKELEESGFIQQLYSRR